MTTEYENGYKDGYKKAREDASFAVRNASFALGQSVIGYSEFLAAAAEHDEINYKNFADNNKEMENNN